MINEVLLALFLLSEFVVSDYALQSGYIAVLITPSARLANKS